MPGPLLLLSLGSTLFNAIRQKREADQQRRNINASIADMNQSRASIAGQNQAAYSNALSFMSANRGDPNAWRFASGIFNEASQQNTAQDNRMLGMIADLKLQRPKSISALDVMSQVGVGALSGLMLDKIMPGKELGFDIFSSIPWWKRQKNLLGESPAQPSYAMEQKGWLK